MSDSYDLVQCYRSALSEILKNNGIQKADAIVTLAIEELVKSVGGVQFYVPTGTRQKSSERNMKIKALKGTLTASQAASRFNCSVQHVYMQWR